MVALSFSVVRALLQLGQRVLDDLGLGARVADPLGRGLVTTLTTSFLALAS